MPPAAAGPLLTLADDTIRVRPLTEHEREALRSDAFKLLAIALLLLPATLLALSLNLLGTFTIGPSLLWLMSAIHVGLVALAVRKRLLRRRELAGEVLEIDAERRRLRVLTATGRALDPDPRPRHARGPG